MNDEINALIEEFREDYEKNGKDKEPRVWLKEALMRRIPNMTEERAEQISNELIRGIEIYRKNREKKFSDYLKEKASVLGDRAEKILKVIDDVINKILGKDENEEKEVRDGE